ncbi:hypothetical protein [Kocuria rosea]|uniref:hypothetical protein n=1 Tax=Kocuria rosea TaxID=1275 RepID=UPI0011A3E14F|nr:hypothetical protein [Kocuria rosea]
MAYKWRGQDWPTEQNLRRVSERASDERTHCAKGHELNEHTMRLQSNGAQVTRVCLTCEYERRMRSAQARRERTKAHS